MSIEVKGRGKVNVRDTAGLKHSLEGAKKGVFVPSILAHIAGKRGNEETIAPSSPAPASLLYLTITASAKTEVTLDASGLYSSWARWGTMQLVLRTTRGASTILSTVDKVRTALTVNRGESITILGIGYAPRLDPVSIFHSLGSGKFAPQRGQ